ncbi:hypothetical protein ACFLR4_00995 [Bacteroidota bacterium]
MGKYTLILVLGAMTVFTAVNLTLKDSFVQSGELAYNFYNESCARNVANSAVNVVLCKIANNTSYRTDEDSTLNIMGGEAVYSVSDGSGDDSVFVRINVSATYEEETKDVIAYAVIGGGWVPPFVRGAWTANASLDNTISDMFIDGRNHDDEGNIIPNSGVPGVSSSVEFVNTQNAAIGGTTWAGVDYPMTYPEDPAIIEELYDWEGTFPETPDEILGYPEGTLEAIAKSGENGSQWIKNPTFKQVWDAKKAVWKDSKYIGGLSYPVSGVTYVYINNGQEYEFEFEQNNNEGILVIHGPDRSSRIKGVKFDDSTSDGVFKGLLVTDYSFHHHLDILGGVLQLSPNLEMDKGCNGNKDHWVYYSAPAIEEVTGFTSSISGLMGNNPNTGGYGKGRVKIAKWYE